MPDTGPALTALLTLFPGMADDESAVSWAAMADRAGCTDSDVDAALKALEQATRVRSEFDYWRTVITKRVARDWPEVRETLG